MEPLRKVLAWMNQDEAFTKFVLEAVRAKVLSYQGLGIVGAALYLLMVMFFNPRFSLVSLALFVAALLAVTALQARARQVVLFAAFQTLYVLVYGLAIRSGLAEVANGESLQIVIIVLAVLIMANGFLGTWQLLIDPFVFLLAINPAPYLASLPMEMRLYQVFFLLAAYCGCLLIHLRMKSMLWRNFRLINKLDRLAHVDELTQIPNRRAFFEAAAELIAGQPQRRAFVAIIDVDFFKKINDAFGHAVGDKALQGVAAILARQFQSDVHGRIGGEEFAVLLTAETPEAARQKLLAFADEVRRPWFAPRTITVSIGVAEIGATGLQGAISEADLALYRAKEGGRDRLEWAGGSQKDA